MASNQRRASRRMGRLQGEIKKSVELSIPPSKYCKLCHERPRSILNAIDPRRKKYGMLLHEAEQCVMLREHSTRVLFQRIRLTGSPLYHTAPVFVSGLPDSSYTTLQSGLASERWQRHVCYLGVLKMAYMVTKLLALWLSCYRLCRLPFAICKNASRQELSRLHTQRSSTPTRPYRLVRTVSLIFETLGWPEVSDAEAARLGAECLSWSCPCSGHFPEVVFPLPRLEAHESDLYRNSSSHYLEIPNFNIQH